MTGAPFFYLEGKIFIGFGAAPDFLLNHIASSLGDF